MSLFDFFLRKKTSIWDAFQVTERFNKAEKGGSFPTKTDYPAKIYLQTRFWDECRDLNDMTLRDEHERAVDFWWIDGDICATSQIRGERGSVTSSYSLQVKYVPDFGEYAYKIVEANGKEILKKSIYTYQIPEKTNISHLFNLHSHPPHYMEGQQKPFYSYFSATDIRSLFASKAVALGMISDRVTLLCKSTESPDDLPVDLSDEHIDQEYLQQTLGIVIYEGHWSKGELVKIEEK